MIKIYNLIVKFIKEKGLLVKKALWQTQLDQNEYFINIFENYHVWKIVQYNSGLIEISGG